MYAWRAAGAAAMLIGLLCSTTAARVQKLQFRAKFINNYKHQVLAKPGGLLAGHLKTLPQWAVLCRQWRRVNSQ